MFLRSILAGILILTVSNASFSQEKWDLRKCVEYALANNISIKRSDVQAKIAAVQYNQTRLSQYPDLNFNGNIGFNSGGQNPATFGFVNQSYYSSSLQLQSNAQIFNWFSKQNAITARRWQSEAAKASVDKLKDDISLTIANAYLQILLTKEQEEIAMIQLHQSKAQLDNTKKLVDAGSLPELNATELEAQVETDSANYIMAKGNVQQNILLLKANMNMDAATPFEVDTPPVELIPIEKIADLQPEFVYTLAVANMPQQRVNNFKLKAAQENAAVAKAGMYPVFSAFGGLTSSYVDIATAPFSTQLSNNFRQALGIGLTVPIFNGATYRGNWQIAKLNIKDAELQKNADDQQLKQDIYQAYNAAIVALQKFNAGKKAVDAAQRSYDLAQKRYGVGMLSTIELTINQNNLLSAKLQYVQDQFDHVFKMKVLEFYKGQGLKL